MKRHLLLQIKTLQNLIVRNICNDMKRNYTSPPTIIQAEIMGYLINHKEEYIYQKDLETVFHLRRSTISGVLQTLEKKGMVKRIDSKNDARVKQIILTKEAIMIYQDSEEYLKQLENKMIAHITKKDLNTFYQVTEQMKRNLENE